MSIAIKAESLIKDQTTNLNYKEILFTYKTIPSLNGWRAVGVLLVILGHLKITLTANSTSYQILDSLIFAEFGVRIFFVLSGFLITTLLIKEKQKAGRVNIVNFFIRRFLRIMPVLWLYLITVAVLNQFFAFNLNYLHFLGPLLYITNFNFFSGTWLVAHTWSLAVEEQFYLIWPFLFTKLKQPLYFCVALIVITPFINVATYLYPQLTNFFLQPFLRPAAAIFMGTILAIVWSKNFYNIPISRYLNLSIFLLALLPIFLINLAQHHGKFGVLLLPTGDFIMNLCLIYMITFSILKSSVIYKLLNTEILMQIGMLSYSIYIWQQLFLVPYGSIENWTSYFQFPVNIIVITIISYLSYHYFEKPFLKLKHRYSAT